MDSYEVAGYAVLSAISASFQIVHIGYPTPWGMWIDIVAIPWILAFFLYGWSGGLIVSSLGALIITFVAPSTWLGAFMKWIATLPMWLVPAMVKETRKLKLEDFKKASIVTLSLTLAIILRGFLTIPTNYYFAIPIWTGWSPEQAMLFLPWYIIFGLNAIQGIFEFLVAWLLIFKFGLLRFSRWV